VTWLVPARAAAAEVLRRRRVRRTRAGGYKLDLPTEERALLHHLLPQLRELISAPPGDPRVERLYPPAFPDDPEKEEEYRRFMREELVASRTAAIEVVEASIDARELDAAEAAAWMTSINAVRLVLGTILDVTEELDIGEIPDDDPDVQTYALYAYLSLLLEEILTAVEP
jgi:hypothetical protein